MTPPRRARSELHAHAEPRCGAEALTTAQTTGSIAATNTA